MAKGTYYPSKDTNNAVAGPREKYFGLVDSVGIYGGFTGIETSRNQRDFRSNQTILSGDIGVKGDPSDNSYHVVYSSNKILSAETILDGFSVVEGNANGSSAAGHIYGGGIFINGGSKAVFKNLIIRHNTANIGGGIGTLGNADIRSAFFDQSIVLTLINCRIEANTTSVGYYGYGGGACHFDTKVRYINCVFLENTGPLSYGGGIYHRNGSLFMYNCTVAGNTATVGEGIRNFESVEVRIYNSIVADPSHTVLDNWSDYLTHTYQNSIINGSGGSSNWQMATTGVDLGGNLDAWPDFIDTDTYRIRYSSIARDAGDTMLLPYDSLDLDGDGITNELISIDFAGNKRLIGAQIDIGALEYAPDWTDSITYKMCPGGQVNFDGRVLDSAGNYDRLVRSTSSGDSVEYFTVVIDSVNKTLQFGQFGGEFISLQDSATYQWISCSNDSVLVGDTSQAFIPTENGSYAVIITNSTGCTDTSECYSIANVSLEEELVQNGLSLYPNPATELLVLRAEDTFPQGKLDLKVYDLSGREIYSRSFQDLRQKELNIDIQNLKSGFYILRVNDVTLPFVKG